MDLEEQPLTSSPAVNHGGGSSSRQIIQKAILFIQSMQIFLAGTNHGSSKGVDGGPEQDENATYEDIEDGVVECVNSDHTAPLLETVDSTSHSRKPMKTLVIHPVQAFKASVATACVHPGSSCTTEGARYKDIEEGIVKCVNSDQAAPLLETVHNTTNSRKLLKTIVNVIRSVEAFKASVATACVHRDSSCATEGNPQVARASDSLETSSEHHITIKNILTIVRQKNLLALQEFGGLDVVKYALCTDLENGISENEALNRSQQQATSQSQAPTKTFCHFLRKEVKKKTILFLLVSVAASVVFEIIQEGLKYGCYTGVVVLIAIVLLVLFASIRKYWQEQRTHKKLRNNQLVERKVKEVHVKRGGQHNVICESKLILGDILLLKKGDDVPCDGLFVGGEGEPLELDCGGESCIINEQNPFLSHGEKVINGEARMVVTSTTMESGWSEMMRKAASEGNMRFRLVTQLDKLNNRIHNSQIVIGILIVLVLIFRHVVGKIDDENANGSESLAEPTAIRSFTETFKKIIKESRYTTKDLTKLLSVSLVGLTEGVPFVISLTIVYWNNKTLFGKGVEQDPHVVAKMAAVSRICTDTFITEDVMEVEELFIGGDFISRKSTLCQDVVEVLRDGIGTLNQKPFPRVKDMFGFKSEKRWKIIETKGAKSFEEPCGVLMRGIEENKELVWHFNGPLKEILSMCKHYYDIKGHRTPLDDEMTQKLFQADRDRQHEHKLTTIALAYKPIRAQTQDVDDLILIALLVLKIKNNDDINTQVKELRKRGIETAIVSSKKITILQGIALKCEVVTNGGSEDMSVVTGEVFRKYTDEERHEKVDKIRVLSEALPSDKLLLVETLAEKGKAVIFLGRRTDEAPALKTAHIGIAMGTWSSEKAIENCDIIMDGIFGDLITMVDSGNCIYYNIQSFVQIVLIMTFGNTLIGFIETAAFGDDSLPIFQLVLLNFTVVVLGGVALLTKAPTDKPVSSVPISCEQSVIIAEMARNIILQVSYQAICSVIIQLKGSAVMGPNKDMKTMVSNIFILCQFFNLFNARELQKKNFFKGIHRHKEFWVATAMFIVTHTAFIMAQDVLGYGKRLHWKLWAGCVLLGAVSWLVDWLGKYITGFIKIFVNRLR